MGNGFSEWLVLSSERTGLSSEREWNEGMDNEDREAEKWVRIDKGSARRRHVEIW